MRPTIGLNGGLYVRTPKKRQRLEVFRTYTRSVERAGGVPVLLPVTPDPAHIDRQLDVIHGLLLTGGADYAPELYGAKRHPKTRLMHPERQVYDLELARAAIRRKVPLFGICGGHQLVNIVCGGDLLQHVPDVVRTRVVHQRAKARVRHDVIIQPETLLARIVGPRRLRVNSSHHQAVGRVGAGLRVAARSVDGLIEAIEGKGDTFILCVQWHPESLAARRPRHLALFEALIDASRRESSVA